MRRALRTAAQAVRLARLFSDLGPETSAAVVWNTWGAHGASRRLPRGLDVPRDPGALVGAEPVHGQRTDRSGRRRRAPVGVHCSFSHAEVEVRFLADDLVRISWGPDEPPEPWALAGDPLADPPGPLGPVKVTARRGGSAAASSALAVRVLSDGSILVLSPAGDLLRRELPPLREGVGRTHRHLLRDGERLVGLGEQAGGLELEGRHRLWNRDPGGWAPGADPLYCVVPVLIGLHAAGNLLAFFENPAEGEVEVIGRAVVTGAPTGSAQPRVEVRFASGMLRHYVATGPVSVLLERYASLTGRPSLPPRWALGYHQSRWGYVTDAQVRDVARGFRDEGLPLSVVHLDIDYMDGYRVFTVDTERFPDLAALSGDLARQGTRVVTILDPAVKADPRYDVYAQGRDHFVRTRDGEILHGVVWPGRAAFPDFTDAGTRRWWGGLYRRLLDEGVAGVWHDMNEPTSIALWGDRTLPRDARHAAGDHRACHNVYGLLMAEAGGAALEAARPERRPFILSRSGWAGLQRRSWIWTGDAETSWASLRQQVATVLGLGMSGMPFSGPDIGGFTGSPTGELYLRWLELAVFLPLCRTHCTASAARREPWCFPEPTRSLVGDLIRFRYRLLPYLYTLVEESARTGRPPARPLGWPATADTAASADEFLLGDALLVAPVTVLGARSRRVVLPEGGWAPWTPLGEDGDAGVGPVTPARSAVVDAQPGKPAVFVRAGTVLPLDDGPYRDGTLALAHELRLLALHCVPGPSGAARGDLYDDAGDGYGPFRRHRFTLASGAGGRRTLRWEREGEHPDPTQVRVVLHGSGATAARADGVEVPYEVVRARPQTGAGSGAAGLASVATVVECAPFETLELL
jgi:alpha-glucosidase